MLEYTSLFGYGVLEEAEGKVIDGKLSMCMSANSTLSTVNNVLIKSSSMGSDMNVQKKVKKERKLKEIRKSCEIIRPVPKQDVAIGPKGIAAFTKQLPPLDIRSNTRSAPESRKEKLKVKLIGGSPTPLLSEEMVTALQVASRAKEEHFSNVLQSRVDLITRDPSWRLMETAKRNADDLLNAETKKTREDKRRLIQRRKEGSQTVTALKRRSMETTKLALKNKTAVVKGVVARYNDPELLALESLKEIAKKKKKKKRSTENTNGEST